eukprot:GDKI01016002.1.p1 GENE.GDKI01016002.1~~GDKI01016002.1.p1  ORF type:complete len:236 (-),score=53.61 GDKI01016002.1:250-957(-)
MGPHFLAAMLQSRGGWVDSSGGEGKIERYPVYEERTTAGQSSRNVDKNATGNTVISVGEVCAGEKTQNKHVHVQEPHSETNIRPVTSVTGVTDTHLLPSPQLGKSIQHSAGTPPSAPTSSVSGVYRRLRFLSPQQRGRFVTGAVPDHEHAFGNAVNGMVTVGDGNIGDGDGIYGEEDNQYEPANDPALTTRVMELLHAPDPLAVRKERERPYSGRRLGVKGKPLLTVLMKRREWH